jgi:hypothetical protein
VKTLTASRVRVMLNQIADAEKWLNAIEKAVDMPGQDRRFEWVRGDLAEIRGELLHVSLADVEVETVEKVT